MNGLHYGRNETKTKEILNKDINGYRLICTETKSEHYGNGFIISPIWKEHIYKFWRLNDRISILQLQTENSTIRKREDNELRSRLDGSTLIIDKNKPVDHMINIINVYAPTSEKVEKDKKEIEEIYAKVEKLIEEFSKITTSITLIAGDFNAKVGKSTNEEQCLGKYSKGKRNESGQIFIDFCEKNNLFVCNSAFQHPSRHITTWSQQRIEKKTNTVKVIYNQIDYILMNKTNIQNMTNARSYAGTETFSDHRLVIMEYETNWMKL